MRIFLIFVFVLHLVTSAFSQAFLLKTYDVPEAQQAVAVGENHFYVINNHSITKHLKSDGSVVAQWDGSGTGIKHLNSGVVIGDTLFCSHSNFPEVPMASSITYFDCKTMRPIGSHSFGIMIGSATWIDRYKGSWYVAFAHYGGNGSSEGKGPEWTQLIRFDKSWHREEGWIFPKQVIESMKPYSTSGGVWDRETGRLYISGHDKQEIYVMTLPEVGYTLEMNETITVPIPGQGIAWDYWEERILWGIDRQAKKVVKVKLP